MDERLFKTIHERARLKILTYLASKEDHTAFFNDIKKQFSFTSGNLSIQLKNLEEANLITVDKSFSNRRPLTCITLTENGRKALLDYVDEMEKLFKRLK